MTEKVRVDVERVLSLQKQIRDINKLDFEQIVWFEKGEELKIPKEVTEEWLGLLNNTDFIGTGYYKKEVRK